MSVQGRPREDGTIVYYVVFRWHGRQIWENAGTVRRKADSLNVKRKAEVKAGTYRPSADATAPTLRQYLESWLVARTVRSVEDERRWMRLYVLCESREWLTELLMEDVRPRHTAQLLRELRAETKPDGSRRLTDKSIVNILGVLSPMFEDAIRDEITDRNPINVKRSELRREPLKPREIYTRAETATLIYDERIPWPVRVLNALCLLGGLRLGEACGRRWRDLDTAAEPLACLTVATQYGGGPLKTNRPRVVPVHPALARLLAAWKASGFELFTASKPGPDDFIVPRVGARRKGEHWTQSVYSKAFISAAEAVGIRYRSVHATRHTFITAVRRDGARPDVLERVTHNARGGMIDRYTHFEWAPLCEAVACLIVDERSHLHRQEGTPEENGGSQGGGDTGDSRKEPPIHASGSGYAPVTESGSEAEKTPPSKSASTAALTNPPASNGRVTASNINRLASLPRKRPPSGVQFYVSKQLAAAYPHAFDGGDLRKVLRPLRRAAVAIERGRVPGSRKAGRR